MKAFVFYIKFRIYVLATILCLAATAPGLADDTEAPQKIELSARVHTILYSMAVQAENEMEVEGSLPDTRWNELLDQTTERIVQEYADAGYPKGFNARMLSVYHHLNPKLWLEKIKHLGSTTVRLGRTYGMPAAAALVLGAGMEVIAAPILIQMGHPELISVSVFIPYEPIFVGGVILLKNYRDQKKLEAAFGGKGAFLEAMSGYREARRLLKLNRLDDKIFALSLDGKTTEGVVVSRDTWWRRAKGLFGLDKPGLNFATLQAYCAKRKVVNPKLDAIAFARDIDDSVKTLLALNALKTDLSPEAFDLLRAHFSDYFVSLPNHADLPTLSDWTRRSSEIKNIDQMKALLAELPTDTPVRTVARLWQETLLPQWGANLRSLNGKQYNSLKEQFRPLLAGIEKDSEDAGWNDSWRQRFEKYLDAAVPPVKVPATLNQCSRVLVLLRSLGPY